MKTLLVHVEPYISAHTLYLHTCPNVFLQYNVLLLGLLYHQILTRLSGDEEEPEEVEVRPKHPKVCPAVLAIPGALSLRLRDTSVCLLKGGASRGWLQASAISCKCDYQMAGKLPKGPAVILSPRQLPILTPAAIYTQDLSPVGPQSLRSSQSTVSIKQWFEIMAGHSCE